MSVKSLLGASAPEWSILNVASVTCETLTADNISSDGAISFDSTVDLAGGVTSSNFVSGNCQKTATGGPVNFQADFSDSAKSLRYRILLNAGVTVPAGGNIQIEVANLAFDTAQSSCWLSMHSATGAGSLLNYCLSAPSPGPFYVFVSNTTAAPIVAPQLIFDLIYAW